jgi:hypothetical protein
MLQVAQLLAPEREKLLHLPEALHQRVVGQEQAVDAVADAIQRQGFRHAQLCKLPLRIYPSASIPHHAHVSWCTM